MSAMAQPLKVFVLMPFDPEFTDIYTSIIVPAFESEGYEVKRADSFHDQRSILEDIVTGIVQAELIVADLTTLNANVMYELGIAHGLKKKVVLLAQEISQIPFDLRPYRVFEYSTHFIKANELQGNLKTIAKKNKAGELSFSDPVSDYDPSTPLDVSESRAMVVQYLSPSLADSETEDEPAGIVDYSVEVEEALHILGEYVGRLGTSTNELAAGINNHTSKLHEINVNLPGSAIKRQRIAQEVAQTLDTYVEDITAGLPHFRSGWRKVTEGIAGILTFSNRLSEADREALITVIGQMEELQGSIDTGLPSLELLRDSFDSITRINRTLNRASKSAKKTLGDVIDAIIVGRSEIDRVIHLLHKAVTQAE